MKALVCIIIIAVITHRVSVAEHELWVMEGNQIAILAPPAADNLASNTIYTITWFNSTNINRNRIIVSLGHPNNDRFSIDVTDQTYGNLIIDRVNRTDAGYYTCQVVGTEFGTYWTSSSYLDVYYMDPPTISANFIWSTAKKSNTTFFCTWFGIYPNKKPVVAWFLDGSELNITTTKFILKEEDGKRTLVILNISEIDFGHYTCSITVDTNRGTMNKMSKNFVELRQQTTGLQDSNSKISKTALIPAFIVTAVTATILGSVPTCLICRYIHKRQEREIHLQYQNSQYQALQFPPAPGVDKELNVSHVGLGDGVASTWNDHTNKTYGR